MAPALTEPLSPKEKLTKKSITPTVPKTRSSRRGNSLGSPVAATTISNIQEEVVERTLRRTRSKDCSSQPNKNKNSKTSKEQMGLTTALSTNNNTNKNNSSKNKSNNNNNNSQNEESTKEILANLTINFEEAISAEICLRKQLLDSNLKTNGTEIKDILVIKSGGDQSKLPEQSEVLTIEQLEEKQHMEPELEAAGQILDAIDNNKLTPPTNDEKNATAEITAEKELEKNVQLENQAEEEKEEAATKEDSLKIVEEAQSPLKASVTHVEYFDAKPTENEETVKEEVTDNLEERLSQLDGDGQELCDSVSELTKVTTPATTTITPTNAINVEQTATVVVKDAAQQQQQQHTTVSTGGELEDQDLEEVLRALKGFDPSTASADALCDLNALFGEVYQNMNYEEANTVQINNTIACSTSPVKSTPQQETLLEIEKAQEAIHCKLDNLVLRLRKLQARHMCKHASEEIAGVFEHVVRAFNNKVSDYSLLDATGQEDTDILYPKPAKPRPDVWHSERDCPVSMGEVYSLMRKVETAAKAQQLSTVSSKPSTFQQPVRKSRKTSIVTENTTTVATVPIEPTATTTTTTTTTAAVPPLHKLVVKELYHVAGTLRSELREIQLGVDSDATESSSGCESEDDMISYNNHIQRRLPM